MNSSTDIKSKKVLIIDDDITSLDIVAFMFEEKGFSVVRHAGGHSAIEYLKEDQPDIIVVDLMMPELSGVDTVKAIRAKELSSAPIIAFTAVDDQELHNEALSAGCNEVLTKPCPSAKLVRSLENISKTKLTEQ